MLAFSLALWHKKLFTRQKKLEPVFSMLKKADSAPKIFLSIVSVALVIAFVASPYMGVSSLAYFLMIYGLIRRKERIAHSRLMKAAMLLDFSMVLFLELTRNATGTAMHEILNSTQLTHVACSTTIVLLYVPIYVMGSKLLANQFTPWRRRWHIRIGLIAFVLRSIGFVTMFGWLNWHT